MATLNYNWQMLAQTYVGSTGSLNVYVRLYAKINSQSTVNNTSSVTYENRLYAEGGGSYFYTGSTTTKTISGTGISSSSEDASGTYYKGETTLQTRTATITHNSDGTKNISASASFYSSPWGLEGTASTSADLPKINRGALTNSVTGSDIDGNFSVNYTKYNTSYQYKLRISIPDVAELERIDYNTSDEVFTLSQETIESLYSRYTNTNTFNLGFAVEAWSSDGNSKITNGNEKVITAKITGANPIFTDFDFNDINATTLALTGNSKYNINGYSKMRITISTADKAEAQKGATMVKYQLMIGNDTREVAYSDSADVNIDINNASIGEYKVYAIDSRNNSTLVTKLALQNISYSPLYIDRANCNVERNAGGTGDQATLKYSGEIWNNSFGSANNAITLSKYEFKETSSDTWVTGTTNISPTIVNNNMSFEGLVRSNETGYTFNVAKSYDFRITLEDKLSSITVELTPLPSGTPNISLNKNGVGIMCDYDESLGGLLQVGGELYTSNGGKLLWTNPSPTVAIDPGQITLSSDDYDVLEIFYIVYTNDPKVMSGRAIKGKDIMLNALFYYNSKMYMGERIIEYTNDTTLNIGNCRKIIDNSAIASGAGVTNSWIVPQYIVGYKTGLF